MLSTTRMVTRSLTRRARASTARSAIQPIDARRSVRGSGGQRPGSAGRGPRSGRKPSRASPSSRRCPEASWAEATDEATSRCCQQHAETNGCGQGPHCTTSTCPEPMTRAFRPRRLSGLTTRMMSPAPSGSERRWPRRCTFDATRHGSHGHTSPLGPAGFGDHRTGQDLAPGDGTQDGAPDQVGRSGQRVSGDAPTSPKVVTRSSATSGRPASTSRAARAWLTATQTMAVAVPTRIAAPPLRPGWPATSENRSVRASRAPGSGRAASVPSNAWAGSVAADRPSHRLSRPSARGHIPRWPARPLGRATLSSGRRPRPPGQPARRPSVSATATLPRQLLTCWSISSAALTTFEFAS